MVEYYLVKKSVNINSDWTNATLLSSNSKYESLTVCKLIIRRFLVVIVDEEHQKIEANGHDLQKSPLT